MLVRSVHSCAQRAVVAYVVAYCTAQLSGAPRTVCLASVTDYGNLNMVVPPRTPRPDAFILILYYTDVEETGGPTCLAKSAPGELTSYDKPFNPPNNHPGRSPELLRRLYETERPIRYKPGTCALYR
jgi:hypothetical protein